MSSSSLEEYWDQLAENYGDWSGEAYLGSIENEDGQTYCHVYDSELLDKIQIAMIFRGVSGDYERGVWDQVQFMTASEYEAIKQ